MAARSSGTSARNCAWLSSVMADISSLQNQSAMQVHIDVQAAHDQHNRTALDVDAPVENRGNTDRRRTFYHQPLFAICKHDAALDRCFVQQNDIVGERLCQREGVLVVEADAAAK